MGSEGFQGIGEVVGRPDFPFQRCQGSGDQAEGLNALPAFLPELVPSAPVASAMAFDVAGRSLDREMRRCERHETEERPILRSGRMVFQAPDRVIGDRCCGVIIRAGRDRLQCDLVFRVETGGEVTIVIIQPV